MRRVVAVVGLAAAALSSGCATSFDSVLAAGWRPEERTIAVREPAQLAAISIPAVPPPATVADPPGPREAWELSLNEAVRISLENAKAVRVFTGLGASNSGRTIYDAAIANTAIDQAQGRFDPALTFAQNRNRSETPALSQTGNTTFGVGGTGVDTDSTTFGLSKLNAVGGRTSLNLNRTRTEANQAFGTLNPQTSRGVELAYAQPLLQGGGFLFNQSAIVIARLDTERSYFSFKDATQELVRGTIDAYWQLVFSRLELWAREIQYEQSGEALKRETARQAVGIANAREVSQARVTFNQFKAGLVAANAAVLAREAALRNVLGLPVGEKRQIVPVSAPANARYQPEWDNLLKFAEQRRPDIIELKLVLEADAQRRIQAENAALPQLDATASYRWNGLTGTLPVTGRSLSTDPGQFTDWTVGINFAVPLFLREGRARVRQQDLIILRDKANLEQGLHNASHELAITVRDLESTFEQYLAFQETRKAALVNLQVQIEEQRQGRGIYLNVLQALNDWGSAITSEARALVDYNVLLTNLERQTGTILETHGLVFIEERYAAAGPLSMPHHSDVREYPKALPPSGEPTEFASSGQPGENAFDLRKPDLRPAKKK